MGLRQSQGFTFMGNQVVFSVSYDHLDDLEGKDFGKLASQIHETPALPRFYTEDKPTRGSSADKGTPGIAFSHYSHASDGVVVAVSSQGITQPSMAFALKTDEIQSGRLSLLKGLKRTSKFMLDEPHSVRKAKVPASGLDAARHNRVAVFGYLTDNSSALYDDPELLTKLTAHMRDPENHRLPRRIEPIAVLDRGEQILVKMIGNCFLPSERFSAGNDMTFEQWSKDVSVDEKDRIAPKESDLWCCKRLLADLGYTLAPLKEKASDKEPASDDAFDR